MAEKKEQHAHHTVHGHAPHAETTASESKAAWYQNKGAQAAGKIIGGLFVAAFIGWLIFFMPFVSTDDATIDADVVKVANQGVSCQIIKISVKEGDRVKKGDLLVELDHSMAADQLEKATADANFNDLDLKRNEALASQQGISRQLLDQKRQAAIKSQADLKIAQLNLDRTYIKSPVDGTVIQKTAVEGNMLETNSTAIIIASTETAWVTANVQEKSVSLVKLGQKVYISIDEGGSLTGKVVDVRSAAAAVFALIPSDNASGNFVKVEQRIPVKVELDPHPGKELRIGQSVVIKIKVR
jgi:RND family efflux transporter MFP subunit